MKDKGKFVVAVKDVSHPAGPIRQGKILGRYREREFAERAKSNLAKQQGCVNFYLGIWHNGKLLY